ncbi:hypothetical protein ADIARSV_0033 [Arcticibacter svalbardensis MN12-7]|uniref:Uncharacterized protein n=1 Tax=Arcticibacter svalbardensis MN12-7 TaxID=1150600 RepID=R9GZ51_9SPHI|nr:hypothetical protein [Arcticibacter svalbardensis]EOR96770.1 hypothetical protein ADIARSV_0033 [Arcticibacter svalbardensis MN12-7]
MAIFANLNRLELDFLWANLITEELIIQQPFLALMMAGYNLIWSHKK